MSVELRGTDVVLNALNQRFGSEQVIPLIDRALEAGADVVKEEIRTQFEKFKDTGATLNELQVTKPEVKDGNRQIIIYWQGAKRRSSIIHLNEYGYMRNGKKYKPRGFNALHRSILISKDSYRKAIVSILESGL